MFVDPLKRVTQTGAPRRAEAAAPGFSVPEEGAAPTRQAAPSQATAGLDAILALQGDGRGPGRRARQLARGRKALDALEALQRAVLLGGGGASAVAALESLGEEIEATGDAGLDSVLLEIETRRAVELAKLGRS